MMSTGRTIRMVAAAVFVLALAACARDDGMMKDESAMMGESSMMDEKADGMLMGSGGHMAAGKAEITEGMNGAAVLKLSHLEVDKVPDGYVYLAKGGDHMSGVSLGKLKKFTGTVEFPIPMGVDPYEYDSMVIWCRQFKVEIGRAYLPGKM